ncbi:MAG: CCDC90 family protein [Gammaproteobacteria bacterium]|nr:CCDC90 family protein [Gammaproteobacteria bacterium]
MTTVTFDTLQLVDKLKAAGIPPEQAEAIVRVISEA